MDYETKIAALNRECNDYLEQLQDALASLAAERGLRQKFEEAAFQLQADLDRLRADLYASHQEALRLRRNPPKDGPRTSSPILGGGL